MFNEFTLTRKINRTHKLDSQYGCITYEDWCRREVDRINSSGGNVYYLEQGAVCAVGFAGLAI